ncbi:hypothetical protein [Candidatus Blastococcus massiliensis]|uniref:hypothetical protein n=1 Tax=Candidatus Blastococcus massiliensis TaxID=1470358 RepID=UPI0004BBCCB3|nr:hypothetical protein [Candidatus Blastococcus massiliensis]
MTASLFVTGTSVVWSGRELRGSAAAAEGEVSHAVAKPVVDGLESSVCGSLVTATAGLDWPTAPDAPRCEECARIAG